MIGTQRTLNQDLHLGDRGNGTLYILEGTSGIVESVREDNRLVLRFKPGTVAFVHGSKCSDRSHLVAVQPEHLKPLEAP